MNMEILLRETILSEGVALTVRIFLTEFSTWVKDIHFHSVMGLKFSDSKTNNFIEIEKLKGFFLYFNQGSK